MESSLLWVKARYNCTHEHLFDELVKRLKMDVTQFNNLQAEKNPKGTQFAVQNGQRTFRVLPGVVDAYESGSADIIPDPNSINYPDHIVEVFTKRKKIIAQRGEGFMWKLEITTKWNPDKLECDYRVGEDVRSLSDLSQCILGDFMFERLDQ